LQVYDAILAAKNIDDILAAGDPCSCSHYIAHGKWCSCTLAALSVREKKTFARCWKPPPDETVEEAMIAVFGASKEAPVYYPVATQALTTSDLLEASAATIGKAGAGRPRKNRIQSKGARGSQRARGQYACDRCGQKGHNSKHCTGVVATKKLSKAQQAKLKAKMEESRLASEVTGRSRAATKASLVVEAHSVKLQQDVHKLGMTEDEIACAYRAVVVALKNDLLLPSPTTATVSPTTETTVSPTTKTVSPTTKTVSLTTETVSPTTETVEQQKARVDDIQFQLSIVEAYQGELDAAKKCRRARVAHEAGAAIKEEVVGTRADIVTTAVASMRVSFAGLSDSTRKYLSACTPAMRESPESPGDSATDPSRCCFICLANDEEDEDGLNALVCGQCSKPGTEPKWIHHKCLETYVMGKLSSGVSLSMMTCPHCREKTTTSAMERAGVSGFLGPRTNVSFPLCAADTLYSDFASCLCTL
jgi:hypothetical protein